MSGLDRCTGSGCIAVSLKALGGYARVAAADISPEALEVAEKNAGTYPVEFRQSDMFAAFEPGRDMFDVIVSNPPYIPSEVIRGLEPEVRDHEPLGALDGKEDGLYFYRILAEQCGDFLNQGGSVYFETGHGGEDAFRVPWISGYKGDKGSGGHGPGSARNVAGADPEIKKEVSYVRPFGRHC